jgi:hypothetical protein
MYKIWTWTGLIFKLSYRKMAKYRIDMPTAMKKKKSESECKNWFGIRTKKIRKKSPDARPAMTSAVATIDGIMRSWLLLQQQGNIDASLVAL